MTQSNLIDGIAEVTIKIKNYVKEDDAYDVKLDVIAEGTIEGKLDGKLIENIIIHRFLPYLVFNFY